MNSAEMVSVYVRRIDNYLAALNAVRRTEANLARVKAILRRQLQEMPDPVRVLVVGELDQAQYAAVNDVQSA